MTVAPEPGSEDVDSTVDSVGVDYTESVDYPVLQYVLLSYFGSAEYRRPDRSQTFVEKYLEHGEGSAEFTGLAAELRKAIRAPKSATPMLNEALGIELEPLEVRNHLAALLDQITQQGDFDVDAAQEKAAREKAEAQAQAPTPDDLLDNYFWRKVRIPGMKGREVSLWMLLVGGFMIGAIGIGLDRLTLPPWLDWISVLFIVAGLLIIGLTAAAMRGLREELRRPEKEAKRASEKAAADAKRAARRSERRGLRDLL